MDYEKKYKVALEQLKGLIEGTREDRCAIVEEDIIGIFPELAESEDERIRKWIISDLKDSIDSCAYCERTKPQALEAIAWLEKQGEQKPDDKVEPKFMVGDWIIFNENHSSIYQVERIDKYRYYLRHYLGGTLSVHFDNELIRQWTIQDAKNGDVLVYNNSSVEIILLFKKWMNGVGEGAYSYAHTFNNKILFNDWSDCGYFAHPATKEQRELLFHKMHEAGYEWNKEKKELRKIEKQDEKPADTKIMWHDVSEEPEEMKELLVEWDSEDATWHEVAFYGATTKSFNVCGKQLEGVTRWCYIDDILEKQGKQKEYTFKSLPRLLDMIEPTSKAKAYCQKLIDTLVKEGYSTDAKIVGECLKQMNGEKVALATMDEKQAPKWTEEDKQNLNMALDYIYDDYLRNWLKQKTLA